MLIAFDFNFTSSTEIQPAYHTRSPALAHLKVLGFPALNTSPPSDRLLTPERVLPSPDGGWRHQTCEKGHASAGSHVTSECRTPFLIACRASLQYAELPTDMTGGVSRLSATVSETTLRERRSVFVAHVYKRVAVWLRSRAPHYPYVNDVLSIYHLAPFSAFIAGWLA